MFFENPHLKFFKVFWKSGFQQKPPSPHFPLFCSQYFRTIRITVPPGITVALTRSPVCDLYVDSVPHDSDISDSNSSSPARRSSFLRFPLSTAPVQSPRWAWAPLKRIDAVFLVLYIIFCFGIKFETCFSSPKYVLKQILVKKFFLQKTSLKHVF